MIILSETPCRISLFGGGTDLPSFSDKHGGLVINMGINLKQHVILYTDDDIFAHPGSSFPYTAKRELFWEILKKNNLGSGHLSTVNSQCDAVLGAGLGTSASASVALVSAIRHAEGKKIIRDKIAEEAWDIEVNKMGWYGGKQDQYASSYGGLNVIHFHEQTSVFQFDRIAGDNLVPYLNLFYTGGYRESSEIQKGFKKLTIDQEKILIKMKDITILAQRALQEGRMESLGKLLNETWELKKASNKGVTTSKIDEIYKHAKKHGAIGGKLLGAGGAGYMIFFVPPEKRQHFLKAMEEKNLERNDFNIDYQGIDVRIL